MPLSPNRSVHPYLFTYTQRPCYIQRNPTSTITPTTHRFIDIEQIRKTKMDTIILSIQPTRAPHISLRTHQSTPSHTFRHTKYPYTRTRRTYKSDKRNKTTLLFTMNIFLYEGAVEPHKLDATSSMILFKNYIHYSSKHQHNNYHFYYPRNSRNQHTIPFPELQQPNIHCYTHQVPGSWYRFHFDTNTLKKHIKMYDTDFDLIFTNDIETAPHLNELFNRRWHFQIPIYAYWDWVEIPESNGNLNNFIIQLSSVLTTTKTGVNSQWQKQIILDYARKYFNTTTINQLDQKIQPLYIGIETDEISSYLKPHTPNPIPRLLWNHRISPQTGFHKCLVQLDTIYKTHPFTLIVTNPNNKPLPSRPYISSYPKLSRESYFQLINSCDISLSYFQSYSAWSMSITDAIACHLPVLAPSNYCFPEMFPSSYPYLFSSPSDFRSKLLSLLTNLPSSSLMQPIHHSHDWNTRIHDWISFLEPSHKNINTTKAHDILSIIQKSKSISKRKLFEQIGFGGMIKWTPYRNFLLSNNITEPYSKTTIYQSK